MFATAIVEGTFVNICRERVVVGGVESEWGGEGERGSEGGREREREGG